MSRKRKEPSANDADISMDDVVTNTSLPTAEILPGPPGDGLPMAIPANSGDFDQQELDHDDRTPIPDPFSQHQINLTADSNGPKIRLQRSNRYRQMRIVTDEKPAAKYLQAFRDAGMKWRNEDKAWTIQLEKDAAWRTALDIERVFLDVANGIRQDNGLPEIQPLGR